MCHYEMIASNVDNPVLCSYYLFSSALRTYVQRGTMYRMMYDTAYVIDVRQTEIKGSAVAV